MLQLQIRLLLVANKRRGYLFPLPQTGNQGRPNFDPLCPRLAVPSIVRPSTLRIDVGGRQKTFRVQKLDDFDPQFAEEEAFYQCRDRAYTFELASVILGSVVFGESLPPIEAKIYNTPKLLYRWPVSDPIKLDHPLSISGKQGIWKIQF